MSYVKIWVHLVFSTKTRDPFLSKDVRYRVQKHIIANCIEKNIYLQAINGYTDHLHCLISLGKDQSMAQVAQLIKGESSYWINKNGLMQDKFSWQDDYYAVSVSPSHLVRIQEYIKNQETHHAKSTYAEEVEDFVDNLNFTLIRDIQS